MLADKKIVILVADKFHEEEMTSPKEFFSSLGCKVDVVGLSKNEITGKYGKLAIIPDKELGDIDINDYDGLLIPGGGAPERLRINDNVLNFVRNFWKTGRPVGTICHGPQVLISAQLLDGITTTCYIGIRDDVQNVGANYIDKAVVVDGQLVSSRTPDDLDQFNEAFKIELLKAQTKDTVELDALQALEIAVDRERKARDFYLSVASKTEITSVKHKFKYLATIENEHYERLLELYKKLADGKSPKITTDSFESEEMDILNSSSSLRAIEFAISMEDKAYEFYKNLALKSKGAKVREMFNFLASEELEHKKLFSVERAALKGGQAHFQWATHFDIPPSMDDLW